jgi:hypothetical protein
MREGSVPTRSAPGGARSSDRYRSKVRHHGAVTCTPLTLGRSAERLPTSKKSAKLVVRWPTLDVV